MSITAIILAGGKSSRMGQDKGLMPFEGIPMIQHVINAVYPLVDEILIISNKEEYEVLGYPVFPDIKKNKGPLAGICCGLQNSKTSINIVLSCDTPYITSKLLLFLIDKLDDNDVVYAQKDNKQHPLICTINKSSLVHLQNQLKNENLKLSSAFSDLTLKIIDCNQFDNKIFTNINSKNDIKN